MDAGLLRQHESEELNQALCQKQRNDLFLSLLYVWMYLCYFLYLFFFSCLFNLISILFLIPYLSAVHNLCESQHLQPSIFLSFSTLHTADILQYMLIRTSYAVDTSFILSPKFMSFLLMAFQSEHKSLVCTQ